MKKFALFIRIGENLVRKSPVQPLLPTKYLLILRKFIKKLMLKNFLFFLIYNLLEIYFSRLPQVQKPRNDKTVYINKYLLVILHKFIFLLELTLLLNNSSNAIVFLFSLEKNLFLLLMYIFPWFLSFC